MRILLVEDNLRLAGFVSTNLERAGFNVDVMSTIGDAEDAVAITTHDAMVLDLGLPDGDGLDLLRRLRRQKNMLPILILTARDAIDDRVEGLNAGADDYLPKPFEHLELVARLRAILRRPHEGIAPVLTVGDLAFHTGTRELRVDGRVVPMPPNESELIELLMRRTNQVLTKQGIEGALQAGGADLSPNAVEARMYRLRRRLETEASRVRIHTVAGVGYLLAEGGDA